MRREFYFQDDRSNKFWTIELVGRTCLTTHGRIGAKPRETRKEFPTEEAAQREVEKQVAAKVRKGYVEGALAAAPEHIRPAWSTMTMSDDWFLYERCAVVANGREFHESVLANPAEMPKDMEFEALLCVAPSAYERKTGRECEHISPVSYETFRNHAGWHGRREAGPADTRKRGERED